MFVRIYRPKEDRELLFNVNHISKIEVKYAVPNENGDYWVTSLPEGLNNPAARKVYTVYVGGDSFRLPSNPDDPVLKVIEEIYKSAIKGEERETDD